VVLAHEPPTKLTTFGNFPAYTALYCVEGNRQRRSHGQ